MSATRRLQRTATTLALVLVGWLLVPVVAQAQQAPVALENPGFDGDADGWMTGLAADGSAWSGWVADDAGNRPGSGSIEFGTVGGHGLLPALESTTCIVVDEVSPALAGKRMEVRVRLRYRVMAGSGNLLTIVQQGFAGDDPATDPPCIGPFTGMLPLQQPVAASDGFMEYDSGWQPLAGGPLAMLGIGFQPADPATPFLALVDDVQMDLRADPRIFGHGFQAP